MDCHAGETAEQGLHITTLLVTSRYHVDYTRMSSVAAAFTDETLGDCWRAHVPWLVTSAYRCLVRLATDARIRMLGRTTKP